MRFISATTTERDIDEAIGALVTLTEAQIDGRTLDFVLVFLSPHFGPVASQVSDKLRKALNPHVLLGCTGEGVIGREQEIEHQPALALVGAHLPDVKLVPFMLHELDWHEELGNESAFRKTVALPDDGQLVVMLADPFSTPMDGVLAAFNTFYDGLPIIGGLASGAAQPGGNALLLNDRVLTSGAVGVSFAGEVEVDVIVSQGCRPIGRPFTVSAARQNVILALEGESPFARLQSVVTELSDGDRALLQKWPLRRACYQPTSGGVGAGRFSDSWRDRHRLRRWRNCHWRPH